MDDIQDLEINGWILKYRNPEGEGKQSVIFMIHGWTGDEKSMWVFASRLPRNALLITPRAPYVSRHSELGGYSWVAERGQSFSSLDMFQPSIDSFSNLLTELATQLPGNYEDLGMVGFSQGAAFSYAFALKKPERVNRLASLAGFLPTEHGSLETLASIPAFIAHGTEDETVPIAMARDAKSELSAAGVKVTYCESETGHKLGSNCAMQLRDFFKSD